MVCSCLMQLACSPPDDRCPQKHSTFTHFWHWPTNITEDRTTTWTHYPSTRCHTSSPIADENVGIQVWFIFLISVSLAGPWEGSAIKLGLRPGLFNTVSVKWLKVDGCRVWVAKNWSLFVQLEEKMTEKLTAQKEECLSLFVMPLLWGNNCSREVIRTLSLMEPLKCISCEMSSSPVP